MTHITKRLNSLTINGETYKLVKPGVYDALLAAVEAAEAKLEEVYLADCAESSTMPDVKETLAQLRAAIAVARGVKE